MTDARVDLLPVVDCPSCGTPMIRERVVARRRGAMEGAAPDLERDRCPECGTVWFAFDGLERWLGLPRAGLLFMPEATSETGGAVPVDTRTTAEWVALDADDHRGDTQAAPRRDAPATGQRSDLPCPIDGMALREDAGLDGLYRCPSCEGTALTESAAAHMESHYVKPWLSARTQLSPRVASSELVCDGCGFRHVPANTRPNADDRVLCGICQAKEDGRVARLTSSERYRDRAGRRPTGDDDAG